MELLQDYEVVLLSSAVCFQELVHLVQIGKLRRPDCRDVGKAAAEALQVLEDYGIKMMPVSESILGDLWNFHCMKTIVTLTIV